MGILLGLHSIIRWLILFVGVAGILRAVWGYLSRLPYERIDNMLGAAFTGMLDLNALTGLILWIILWSGGSRPPLMHPLTMMFAVAVAHGGRGIARGREDRSRHLMQGAGLVLSFGLILLGIQFVA
jgi:hypothetical protein